MDERTQKLIIVLRKGFEDKKRGYNTSLEELSELMAKFQAELKKEDHSSKYNALNVYSREIIKLIKGMMAISLQCETILKRIERLKNP